MRTIIFLLLCMLFFVRGLSQQIKNIKGVVTYLEKPMSDVNVLVKGTSIGTKTNNKGEFQIDAKTGEVLNISYIGFQTVEITVTEEISLLDIVLSSKVEELNEVVVKKQRASTQKQLLADYPVDKGLIKTRWGIIDKDHSSYAMKIIDGKNLVPIGDFITALQVQYPGLEIDRTTDPLDPKIYFLHARRNKVPAIYDVDGIIYEKAPTFLDIRNIDRIAIIPRNGAFAKYGPQGSGGVIIINTKEQARIDELGVKRKYDNSDLMDSIKTQLNETRAFVPKVPKYMVPLNNATSELHAKEIFKDQNLENVDITPYYYLETSDYFEKRWGDSQESDTILKVAEEKYPKDVNLLKAIAYTWEEKGEWDNAYRLYLKILKLRSRDGQSHLDLGMTCSEMGKYQKSLSIYAQYARGVQQLDTVPFGFFEVDQIMITESNNILRLKENKLLINGIGEMSEKNIQNQNTRLVFEWNNSQAEFELQFINPRDNYDTWNNIDGGGNEEDLLKQKEQSNTSKQFFLDQTLQGEWDVNIHYYGNQTENPTYLKVKTYFDFGKPMQRMELKVFKLSEEDKNFYLFTIDNDKKILVNKS